MWVMVHGEAVCVGDGAWRGCVCGEVVCVMVHGEAVCVDDGAWRGCVCG